MLATVGGQGRGTERVYVCVHPGAPVGEDIQPELMFRRWKTLF